MTTRPSGLNLQFVDEDVRPQDNLFRHVNGQWLNTHVIPDDRSSDGAFYELRDLSEERVKALIEEAGAATATPGSTQQKIGDLYRSFMNEEHIESLGVTPIQRDLDRALSVSSLDAFIELVSELEARGGAGLFGMYVTADKGNSAFNTTYLSQGGLSLPDESYYREEQFAEIREKFVAHVAALLALAGIDNGPERAASILALETTIARSHWDNVRSRDAEATFNPKTRAELVALSPNFPWAIWERAGEVPSVVLENVIVRQPSYFEGLSTLLGDFEASTWQSWLAWQIVSGAAPYLSSAFVAENFAFYGTVLSGIPTLKPRWKRGVGLVEGALGEAVGELYVARHFPPASKTRMVELVANLIEAYRVDIQALSWMTPETKEKALEKLSKFKPKIGYPDKWRDYSGLSVSTDLMANVCASARFERDVAFAKVAAPVDKAEWLMTPQTVNAYYMPTMNDIVFPAAILQPPFFDAAADDAALYGGIGAVIGHEIGHGFDDQGSKYDGDGNLANWWSDEDRAAFDVLSSKLIAQYDELHPEATPDIHVNGALTIGENIGDLGGITIALKAYEISLAGAPAPEIDGLTGAQRFFFGWAQIWRGKQRPEELRNRIATDPHSPDVFRCNQIVKNLVEFHEAFDVVEGDSLYMSPEDCVRIW
jgi:putative endopeptidase